MPTLEMWRKCAAAICNLEPHELARELAASDTPRDDAQGLLNYLYCGPMHHQLVHPADPSRTLAACVEILVSTHGADPWQPHIMSEYTPAFVAALHVVEAIDAVAVGGEETYRYVASARTTLDTLMRRDAPRREEALLQARIANATHSEELCGLGHEAKQMIVADKTHRMAASFLPMLFVGRRLRQRALAFMTNQLEQDVRAFAPFAEEVCARCPYTGATMLHRALKVSDASRLNEYGILVALDLSNAAHALLKRGADPLARCARLQQTPLEHWSSLWRDWVSHRWGPRSPVHDVLEFAEADLRERQVALAMSQHPRLGAGSLLSLMDADVLRAFIATSENCVAMHTARRSPQATYAMRLATVLATEENDVCVPTLEDVSELAHNDDECPTLPVLFQECVRTQAALTDGLRGCVRALATQRRRTVAAETRREPSISDSSSESEDEEDE